MLLTFSTGVPSHRYSMASTSETYNSGFGENSALFRQSQSMTSSHDPNMSQLALPGRAAPLGRDLSPASTESGGEPHYPMSQGDESEQLSQMSPQMGSTSEAPLISPVSYQSTPMFAEPDPVVQPSSIGRTRQPSHGRGVSLVDSGPVPVAPHDPVRRVSRHVRRQSSRNQLANSASGQGYDSNLPPGAVSKWFIHC